MKTNKNPAAGDEIDSKCLKCKDVTNHTIIALKEKSIAKVQCKVCDARHIYRPAKATKTKTAKPKAVKKTSSQAARNITAKKNQAEKHFLDLLEGKDTTEALTYSMTSTFGTNDIIDHHMFGLGFVTSTIQPNKIEVTFINGSKTLISVLKKPVYPSRKRPMLAKKRGRQPKVDEVKTDN